MNKLFLSLMIFSILFASSCKKEIIQNHIYDNVIYQLDTVPIYSSALEKTKKKTNE